MFVCVISLLPSLAQLRVTLADLSDLSRRILEMAVAAAYRNSIKSRAVAIRLPSSSNSVLDDRPFLVLRSSIALRAVAVRLEDVSYAEPKMLK